MPPARPLLFPAAPCDGPISHAPCASLSLRKVGPSIPQSGAGLIEFSIVAVPILLLGLGSIEVAHWLLTRQVVSLALLEAGRAGISTHGHPDSIAMAFEQALLPLFPATRGRSAHENQQLAFEQRKRTTANAAWQITIASPSITAFEDFADAQLHAAAHNGLPAINNNYQFEQDQRRRAQGWPDGLGPASKVSIYQANILTLQLSYPHKPVLPGMNGLLSMLGKPQGTYSQRAMAHGYLPLRREISLSMQSHPVRWPMPAGGHIVRPGDTLIDSGQSAPGLQACTGMWCLPQVPAGGSHSPPAHMGNPPSAASGTGNATATPATPAPGPTGAPGTADLAVTPDDPACGLTLCCAPA